MKLEISETRIINGKEYKDTVVIEGTYIQIGETSPKTDNILVAGSDKTFAFHKDNKIELQLSF